MPRFGGYGRSRRQSLPGAVARPAQTSGRFTAISGTASPTSGQGHEGSSVDDTKLLTTESGAFVTTEHEQRIRVGV